MISRIREGATGCKMSVTCGFARTTDECGAVDAQELIELTPAQPPAEGPISGS